MKHYGDITQIHASAVEPVNVIIGGSPCQDLSVAGKQVGIMGERSGLIMEQLRIIKEMREITNGKKPRYMVWENVPGAFSSPKGNKGADFQALLEEIIKITEPEAPSIPIPRYGWPSAGCLTGMEGKWSVAWRVFDAQFWGVPQRRKRIALVADFRGETAPEILFIRKSVSGDIEPGGEKEYHPAAPAGGRADEAVGAICIQGNSIDRALTAGCNGKGFTEEVSYTLNTVDRPAVAVFELGTVSRVGERFCWEDAPSPTLRAAGGDNRPMILLESHPMGSRIKIKDDDVVQTLHARMGTGGNNTPLVMQTPHPIVATCGSFMEIDTENKCGTLMARDYKAPKIIYERRRKDLTAVHLTQDPITDDEVAPCLSTGSPNSQATVAVETDYIVRRITPLECERLQGYPDGWTDIGEWVDEKGKLHKESTDAARYKIMGNSIALPPWHFVLQKLSLCCGTDTTMASLFDGAGGFPLIWERLNGKGSCLWASEIEAFPIAVTKRRFSD